MHGSESHRNHIAGICATIPVTKAVAPINADATAENGTITLYLSGRSASIMKNTPIALYVADTNRAKYSNTGTSGSDSTPKMPVTFGHADIGAKIPATADRQKIPAIQRHAFNPRIFDSFQ
jgi:hypothetical protein